MSPLEGEFFHSISQRFNSLQPLHLSDLVVLYGANRLPPAEQCCFLRNLTQAQGYNLDECLTFFFWPPTTPKEVAQRLNFLRHHAILTCFPIFPQVSTSTQSSYPSFLDQIVSAYDLDRLFSYEVKAYVVHQLVSKYHINGGTFNPESLEKLKPDDVSVRLEDIFKSEPYISLFGEHRGFIPEINYKNMAFYSPLTVSMGRLEPNDFSSWVNNVTARDDPTTREVISQHCNKLGEEPYITSVQITPHDLRRIVHDFNNYNCRGREPVSFSSAQKDEPAVHKVYSDARRLHLGPLPPSFIPWYLAEVSSCAPSHRQIIFATKGIFYNEGYYLLGSPPLTGERSVQSRRLQAYQTWNLPIRKDTVLVFRLNTHPPF